MARHADQLDEDIRELEQKVDATSYQPAQLANGAVELLNEVTSSKITGEEERYSRTDLWDFAANVEGAKAAYGVFKPVLAGKDDALVKALDDRFAAVEASLAPYRTAGGGYQPYTALEPADKTKMQAQLASLSEELAKLPAALGVS